MWRYLKAAFWATVDLPAVGPLPFNALAVFGCGILGAAEHAVWLLGLGLETAYLYVLATNPRFQHVITARDQWQTRRGVEQDQQAVLSRLTPEARRRVEQLQGKIRRAAEAAGDASEIDLLGDSNRDALEKLGALHLRLLGVERELQAVQQQTDETGLLRQATGLEQELGDVGRPLSAALRESKQATLDLTQKRLANARRRAENLAEVRSDLTRIEAQVELALEDASLEGKPALVASNLNLLNRILESNRALGSHPLIDQPATGRTGVPAGAPRVREPE